MVSTEISQFTHVSHSVTVAVSNSISEEMEVEVQSRRNNGDDSHAISDEN